VVETTAAVTQAPTAQPPATQAQTPTQAQTAAAQTPTQAQTATQPQMQAQTPAAQAPTQVAPSSGAPPRAVATFPPSTRATPAAPTPAAPTPTAPIDPRAFNPVTAKASLDLVNGILASCRQPGGQRGDGVINVTFANDGSVASAVIDEPPYVGTTEGQCVQSRFKHAKTTPFEGSPGSIVYTFHIPK